MNYHKLYQNIIEKAKSRNINGYVEKHHIKPKCLGGTNNKNNLVILTAREHYLCHKILCKIYPDNEKIFLAWCCMAFTKNSKQKRYGINSYEYQTLREKFSKKISGEKHPMYGKKHSIESKKKISRIGELNPNYGNKWNEEQKIYNSNKTKEWLKNNKHPRLGCVLNDETIKKIKNTKKNNPQIFSNETKHKMSLKKRGKNNQNSKYEYVFISPQGDVYINVYSIKEFATKHNLSEGGIRNAIKKNIKTKGWIVSRKLI